MEELLIPLVGELNANPDSPLPSGEEYTYWKSRQARTFYIDFEINEDYRLIELTKIIIQMNMEEMCKPKDSLRPIFIFIHSYGGDLIQCHALSDVLVASRIPIVTIALGVADSAGFILLLSGHKRFAFARSEVMYHRGSGSITGTAGEIEDNAKRYKQMTEQLKNFVLSRTTIDDKTLNKYNNKDWQFTKEELVSYNIVDKILDDFTELASCYMTVGESNPDFYLL